MVKTNSSIPKIIINNHRGMSLLEILIALTLLALGGTFIAQKVFDQMKEGQYKATVIRMTNLRSILADYRRHCGLYPTSEQGLKALAEKPTSGPECKRYAPGGYLQDGQVPVDAWDNEFAYESSDGKTYKLISFGIDQVPGGTGWDEDIDTSKPDTLKK